MLLLGTFRLLPSTCFQPTDLLLVKYMYSSRSAKHFCHFVWKSRKVFVTLQHKLKHYEENPFYRRIAEGRFLQPTVGQRG